jgi:dCMP deaminase
MIPDWDEYFLGMALYVSSRSKDAQTKHGAIIVNRHNIIMGTGYNSFVRGLPDSEYPNSRPDKYPYMIHAEENAILNSKGNLRNKGIKIYVTGSCCFNCLQRIKQAGINHIICANRAGTALEDEKMIDMKEKFIKDTNMKIEVKNINLNKIIEFFKK